MMLNGKAKEDFSYKYNMSNFNDYSEALQYTLIIEWLDSVGIYVSIRSSKNEFMSYITNDENSFYGNTRQEATKQAIIKANEIYNNI